MRTRRLVLAALTASAACLIAEAQSPTITGLSSYAAAATAPNAIAPGELIRINGSNLGDATTVTCSSTTGFPLSCGGVSVTVAGKAAGVSQEGASQVVIEVPVDAPVGNGQAVVVTHLTGMSQPFHINVVSTAPQLLNATTNGVVYAQCYRASTLLTTTTPANPGDTVNCLGTGFGLSNPAVPTGTLPAGTLPPLVASVTVTFAGQNAKVNSATVSSGTPGLDFLIFVIPKGIGGGAQPLVVSVNGVAITTYYMFVSGTGVTSVANAASNILPGLPNAGIAQGSIFILKGNALGPASISIAPSAQIFQSSTLSGTSVAVEVGNTTVNALMYYTSAGQVAALLPSNTPTGAGTVTATYNGQTSAPAPITVVANNLGIFTIDSSGQGPGIVTYPDYSLVSAAKANPCGGPDTACGAANPGDVLILWATGLGAVNGSDAAGAGLGQAIDVPLTLWLGGIAITPSYQGRSGCCIGEDQIVFTVPDNVPTGCAVPLLVQINDQISNYTVMPVANGSRNCTPTNAAAASVNLEQLVIAGPISVGDIDIEKDFKDFTSNFSVQDNAKISFNRVLTYNPGTQPFFMSFADAQPLGTCIVYNNTNPSTNVPAASGAALDAGAKFTVMGPNGSVTVEGSSGNSTTLSAAGTFLVPGAVTVTGTGGADVGPFSASITVPTLPTLVSPVNNAAVTRSNGLPVTWTGGSGNVGLVIHGNTSSGLTVGATAECTAPASAGAFTIPPYVLLTLPTYIDSLFVGSAESDVSFTATGLDLGILHTQSVAPFVVLTMN